jgi:hypothetical protein
MGTDNHLHQFSYEGGGWNDQDVFQNVIGESLDFMAATGYGWSVPYVYQFNGIWCILYNGADQHIHQLSSIGDVGQIRTARSAQALKLRRSLTNRKRL